MGFSSQMGLQTVSSSKNVIYLHLIGGFSLLSVLLTEYPLNVNNLKVLVLYSNTLMWYSVFKYSV